MEVEMDTTALDGNVAAGILASIFYPVMTDATTSCAHCGAVRQLGELVAYVHAPGVILRCASCEGVVLRLMQNRGRVWLDLRGMSLLQIELPNDDSAP
jgi:hypothetical protein